MANLQTDETLQDFAARIASATKLITEYCDANGHPQPSLRTDVAGRQLPVLPVDAPKEVHLARRDLIDATTRVQQISREPAEYLPQLAVHTQHVACVHWLCRYNIPLLVPQEGTITYAELARIAQVPIHTLKSVVRMAICDGFLNEEVADTVGHSRLSAEFSRKDALRQWGMFLAEATAPMALKLTEATEKWGDSQSKTETAFNLAMNSDLPFFDYLSTSTKLTKRFAGYMQSVALTGGTAFEHLLEGFDWAGLGEAKIVDVGGSSGHASITLAKSFPALRFIVQDLPPVVEASKANLSGLDDSVASRITFQAHDFFKPQPVHDVEIYLLRMILHDWPPAEAASILTNISRALKPGARIIVMDTALPISGSISVSQESQLRVRDLTMMETFNAHEREMDEWHSLFAGIDQRLKIKGVVQPFNSNMAVMEVAFE